MRLLINTYFLLLSTVIFASNFSSKSAESNSKKYHRITNHINSTYAEFEKAASKMGIPQRKISISKGEKEGYYIISGVYGTELNAKKSVKRLKSRGFNSNYVTIVESDLHYVYLKYFTKGQMALNACHAQFNGLYKNAVWIMVANHKKIRPDLSISHVSTKTSKKPITINDETFEEAADKNNITHRTFSELPATPNGYYIISGTFSKTRNRDKAIKRLKKKDFEAGSIQNPKNGLNYVYVQSYSDWKEAIESCKTQFDGRHKDQVWVMQVEKSERSISVAEENDADFNALTEEVSTTEPDLNEQSGTIEVLDNTLEEPAPTFALKETPNKSKLIQKADHYFDKMWYAEAAEIYEQVLLKGDKYYSSEIIQKVADAHYYNTNMVKAHEWYNVLYENYGKELSAENIFKYAHSLKGTGKYARSKRLMRLYNKKIKNDPSSAKSNFDDKPLPNEVVLDNILATSENFEVKNLAINSEYSEFSPMFLDSSQVVFASAQDSSFFNTRKYKWNDQPYLDLYVAKINEESQDLKDAIKFSKKINTKYHEASVTFSPDNTTMYFTRNNYGKKLKRDKNGVNNLKIYMSKKIGDEWTEAIELPFNSDEYSTGHPALSPDGKQLYFVSDMPGSIGGTDLFVVDVLDSNSFSEPKNLGPEINTDKREMFPFFNGKKLYFSSDGHTGLGGLDVFETAYSEEGFSEVKNVGQPVNSNKDDFSYIVDEETQKGFFASNREGGKGDDDIYSFKRLILEEVPANMNAIAGVVTELVTGDLMPQALVILLDENNIKLKEVETGEDGSFMFEDLDATTKYIIKTQKGEYFENELEVATTENDTVTADISMKRLEELIAVEDGIKKLKTEMIHFDFDKSYIRQDAAIELNKMVAVMNEYPEMVIRIESHTDSRGSRAYNEYLSNNRAKSSRDYLIEKGIAPERIESAIGYGEERLINECNGTVRCTEQAHYLNRRSEFIIIKM